MLCTKKSEKKILLPELYMSENNKNRVEINKTEINSQTGDTHVLTGYNEVKVNE